MTAEQHEELLQHLLEDDTSGFIELLFQNPDLDVNWRDEEGMTLLHHACVRGNDVICEHLLSYTNIEPDECDRRTETPLYLACFYGWIPCVELLGMDYRVDINNSDIVWRTPFWLATRYDRIEIVRWFIVNHEDVRATEPSQHASDWKLPEKNESTQLFRLFQHQPKLARFCAKASMGGEAEQAAQLFALMVFVTDGFVELKGKEDGPIKRFFDVVTQLPMDLQFVLTNVTIFNTSSTRVPRDLKLAFKDLVYYFKK